MYSNKVNRQNDHIIRHNVNNGNRMMIDTHNIVVTKCLWILNSHYITLFVVARMTAFERFIFTRSKGRVYNENEMRSLKNYIIHFSIIIFVVLLLNIIKYYRIL